MGFFSSTRHLTVAELPPADAYPVAPLPPIAPNGPASDQPIADKPFADKPFAQAAPAVPLDPIFGTPLTQVDPWLTAQTPAAGVGPDEDWGSRIEIEALGNGYQVNGTMVTGKFDRLSDWLNMQQGWVNVHDGLLMRPGREAAADRPRTSQWVRLDQVVLVAERQPVQRERDRGDAPYVKKERRRVTITTQEFRLRGYVHIVEAGSMRTFLESPDPHFLPMTEVVVRWLVDDAVVSHYPFALVNRAQLISVSEDVSRENADDSTATTPEPAAAEAADVQLDWLRSA